MGSKVVRDRGVAGREGSRTRGSPRGARSYPTHRNHAAGLRSADNRRSWVGGRGVSSAAIRRRGDTPVLILTARDDDVDAIVGLELGADDYVTKPFNPRALVARVKAILRRTDVTARGGRPIDVGALRIDPRRHEATVAGRDLGLRARGDRSA